MATILVRSSFPHISSLANNQRQLLTPKIKDISIDVRGKKTKGGGTTRNTSGLPAGPKLGLKVYDGQRVPQGTLLHNQRKLEVMPGWNVTYAGQNRLMAAATGRVMMTTELCDPDVSKPNVALTVPNNLKPDQKIFRQYLHIIPDRQHQIFKLVEQI